MTLSPGLITACACLLFFGAASAKDFPEKPVKLIVPYSAGGTTDSLARMVAQQMSKHLPQPVIVENVPGAGGNVGAMAVLNYPNDGHTMLFLGTGHLANKYLYDKMGYDSLTDFEPLSRVAIIPNILVVNPKSKIQSLEQLMQHPKLKEGTLNYGSAGNGTTQHLSGALFSALSANVLTHIPYKGGAPAMNDLLAGQIDLVFSPIVEVLPFIESGKLVALATTASSASAALPAIPPVAKLLPNYHNVLWNALVLKKGTDTKRIEILSKALHQGFASDAAKEAIQKQGATLALSTPAELLQMLKSEDPKIKKLVEISNAKAH